MRAGSTEKIYGPAGHCFRKIRQMEEEQQKIHIGLCLWMRILR